MSKRGRDGFQGEKETWGKNVQMRIEIQTPVKSPPELANQMPLSRRINKKGKIVQTDAKRCLRPLFSTQFEHTTNKIIIYKPTLL